MHLPHRSRRQHHHVQTASQSIAVSGDGISQLLVKSRAVLVRDSRVTHTSMASHDWTELAPVPSNNTRDAHGPSYRCHDLVLDVGYAPP